MVPGLQFCFACGASVQVEEASSGDYRMQAEAAPMAPKKMSTVKKLLIALGILVACGFAACGACVAAVVNFAPKAELQSAAQRHREVNPALVALMPPDEVMFCQAVDKASAAARQAGGLSASKAEMEKLIAERSGALYSLTHNPKVSNWVGVVVHMAVGEGAADIELQLPCEAHLTTFGMWPKAEPDQPGHFSLSRYAAKRGTPPYLSIVDVADGESVLFSAQLAVDSKGDLQVTTMSEWVRAIAPTFLMEVGEMRNASKADGTKAGTGTGAEGASP
jgi:hypothetical protein